MTKYRLMAMGMVVLGCTALLVTRELSMIVLILMGLACMTAKPENLEEV